MTIVTTHRRLVLATLAVPEPMGQQSYEQHVTQGVQASLGERWTVEHVVTRSLRSPLPGTRRLPSRLLLGRAQLMRRHVGRMLHRSADLVHRFDLRLLPVPDKEVLTVLDLASWRFPDEGTPPADAERSAQAARRVICPSTFTAEEVLRVFGVTDVVVSPLAGDPSFLAHPALSDGALARLGVQRPFVLHAGGCTARKNLVGLAGAWSRLAPVHADVSLVLCGPPDERRNALFAHLPRTRLLGRVRMQTLVGLMRAASALVVPSIYEGFGLPALEGMACGVPVVASDRSSLPEVCGNAALLVEPTEQALAEGLEAALQGGGEVADLIERGRRRAADFSWGRTVADHIRVYEQAMT